MLNGKNGSHEPTPALPTGAAAAQYAHIVGWGMGVPQRVMTNDDLARIVDTSDEWITSRTGIRQRRIAGPKESTSTLAAQAGRAALDMANIDPNDVDLVIVATCTPDHFFPATACLVQDALGCGRAGAFDVSAACSGFIYGLTLGTNLIRTGAMRTILVIGAETLSRFINWKDRATCVLFGDGAGAFVLQARETPGGLLTSVLRADGSGGGSLIVPAGGSRQPATFETVRDNLHTLQMDGKAVYRFATRVMTESIKEVTAKAGVALDQVQLIVPHQANQRIIESSARSLGLSEDRFVLNLDRYGNTSAASIPIAVCEAVRTLNNAGAKSVTLVATHGLLSGPAVERLKNCGAREIVLTDTVPVPEEKRLPNMTVLSVAPLLAAGIRSVFESGSVSTLLNGLPEDMRPRNIYA